MATIILGCSTKNTVDKNLIYSTINDIIKQDSLFPTTICAKFDKPNIPDYIRNEFFKSDEKFIQWQIIKSVNARIDTGKVYFYSGRNHRLKKSNIDTTCTNHFIFHLTYPIFSKDLQTVIIGINEDCNCLLGGWGFTAVYKRVKGKWRLIKKFDTWIS